MKYLVFICVISFLYSCSNIQSRRIASEEFSEITEITFDRVVQGRDFPGSVAPHFYILSSEQHSFIGQVVCYAPRYREDSPLYVDMTIYDELSEKRPRRSYTFKHKFSSFNDCVNKMKMGVSGFNKITIVPDREKRSFSFKK